MKRAAASAALALVFAACAAPPASAGKKTGDIEVTCELDVPALKPREGELASVKFRIRNATDRIAILRDLTLEGGADALVTWQFSQAGDVVYLPDKDEWTYGRRKAGKRRPVFNSGLLAPTEAILIRGRVRLLDMPKTFKMSYFLLTRQEASQKVYFEIVRNRETRYVLRTPAELDGLLAPNPDVDAAGHRIAIFPYAEQVVSTALSRTLQIDTPLTPRPFRPEEAVRKAGFAAAEERTYTTSFDGWVIRSGGDFRLVTASSNDPLPRLPRMELTFHFLDSLEPGQVEIEFLGETKTLFSGPYRLVTDSSGGRFFLFLPRRELLPFLKDVQESGLSLDAEILPQGGGRLQVTR